MGERWVKLYAKIGDWEWADDPITFAVFVHLLHSANWEDKKWHGVDVRRGEVVLSREEFAKKCGFSVQQLRTAIAHLQSTGEIAVETVRGAGGYTKVKIANWDRYQGFDGESHLTNYQPDANHDSGRDFGVSSSQNQPISNQLTTNYPKKPENHDSEPVCVDFRGKNTTSGLTNYQPDASPDSKPVCGTLQNQSQPIINQLATITPEYIEDKNIDVKKEKENKKEKRKKAPEANLSTLIAEYSAGDEKLQAALNAYAEMRRLIRKPMTADAFRLVAKKLDGLADTVDGKIAILDQSTMMAYQGIWPLKDNNCKGGNGHGHNNASADEYTI